MTQVSQVSPELSRGVLALSRALVTAARAWTLYPPEHPAVAAALDRFADTVNDATGDAVFSFGVSPDALFIEGVAVPPSPPISEAAQLLHERDILQLTFVGHISTDAARRLVALLGIDSATLRARGGPGEVWATDGAGSIAIEQVDYRKVLEDHEAKAPREDDVWKSIVRSIVEGRKTFDQLQQERLLAIAADAGLIHELATAVMAPKHGADGSPMITTQAATVLAAFRHLAMIVSVTARDKLSDVMRNLAEAAASLDPHVVMQMMHERDDADEAGVPVVGGMAAAFDDAKVAQLLATALASDGTASDRLASVFNTIAPDAERKRRVLTLTRVLLSESDFGKSGQFTVLWTSMEELLLSYNETPFVSTSYRNALDGANARAAGMQSDLPKELLEWMETLGQDNVRRLSVILLLDLLRLERDPAKASDIAADVGSLADDLLLAGAYQDALPLVLALRETSERRDAPGREGARKALDAVAKSDGLRESAGLVGDLGNEEYARLKTICAQIGPSVVALLRSALQLEGESIRRERAAEIMMSFGGSAIAGLSPLVDDPHWVTQRNLADLLGRLGLAEGVPLLQTLLRKADALAIGTVIGALADIKDPAAARAIQTVLRTATGDARRAVVSALVAERDSRVVPMLVRILEESDAIKEHTTVVDTIGALAIVGGDAAVRPLATVMARRSWFARAKMRATKEASVAALMKIGSASATAALDEAAVRGDWQLRKIVRRMRTGVGGRQ